MKLEHAETHVLESGGLTEAAQGFKIRVSPHAFKMLSSGVYSDKIAAPIRELGCNAHDAHIQQGCPDLPIEVKLPNNIDSQFYIKDFGPGLSHETVMDLYTTYFASTKQNSNDFTGAFGIGSKSPFAYTDSFTVESQYKGKRNIYSAHIGEDGFPKIQRMTEVDCGDESGVTVGFPVRTTDFSVFKDRAQTIYQFFNPLPRIIGAEPIKPVEFSIDRDLYAFTVSNDYRAPNYVQMGNVVYPLTLSNLGIQYGDNILYPLLQSQRLFLRFRLGELSVAASREQLEYDKKTQEAIKARLEWMVRDMVTRIESMWKTHGQGSFLDRCEFRNITSTSRSDLRIDEKLLNALKIKNAAKLHEALSYNSASLPKKDFGNVNIVYMKKHSRGNKIQRWDANETSMIRIPYEKNLTFIAGTEAQAFARVRKAIMDGTIEKALLMYIPTTTPGTQSELDSAIADVKAELGDFKVTDLADYPKPVINRVVTMVNGKLSKIPVFYVSLDGVSTSVDLVPDNRKIYTVRGYRGSGYVINGKAYGKWDHYQADRIIEKLKKDLQLPAPIFISKADEKRILKHKGWIEFGAYIQKIFNSEEFKTKLITECKNYIAPSTSGALYELRKFRDNSPEGWKFIKEYIPEEYAAVEKEVKILGSNNQKIPEFLENCKTACIEFKMNADFSQYDLSAKLKIKENPALTCDILEALYDHAPNVLPIYLKEVL